MSDDAVVPGIVAIHTVLCNNRSMHILPFDSTEATLEAAGGKGMNLVRLTRAGFAVPPGFLISTDAYREFVNANRWLPEILSGVAGLSAEDASALERASAQMRVAFSAGKMPGELEAAIRLTYAELGNKPVAVRSSATAEDLPDLSFAGQQDTYLNVIGEEQLLEAVVNCWSSLWTARAIGYRIRNGIDHNEAALAVVVQEMVPSDASGVLFTANPLTGLRTESAIDATLGLGEALVSGQVEPDHYVVDTLERRILTKTLGAKKISTRGKRGGGVETIEEDAEGRQALSDEQILQVAEAGTQIQDEYAFPQDIEWALAADKLYILQSRPITSLYPVPKESLDPLIVWFSFGSVQGLLGAITPLGQDAIRMAFSGAGKLFGAQVHYDQTEVLVPAGERLWIKVSDLMRNPIGARIYKTFLGFGEPSVRQILQVLANDPRLAVGKGHMDFGTVRALLGFLLPIVGRVAVNLHDPVKARTAFQGYIESQLVQPNITGEDKFARLAQRLEFMQKHISTPLYRLLPRFIPLLGPSLASLNLLTHMAGEETASKTDHGFSATALEVTRGLPDNVTTEMDLALWNTAKAIRQDAASREMFLESDARVLASRYLSGILPEAAQTAIADFMKRYGMRGLAEIDMGQLRWREEPSSVMQTLQSYLQIPDELAPDVLFKKGANAAELAIERSAAQARRGLGGALRERIVRAAGRRIRTLMGLRESPKFFIVRLMGIIRSELLASGEEFASEGIIEKPEDLFFLHFGELQALANRDGRDWKTLIAERHAIYERENRRKQVPRVLVSDGRAFYEGLGSESDTGDVITGSPVSPGVAEGVVHVIFDPRGAQLAPGEILVCPGTDPAWTPLFMVAGGLITEVGGMMTHGSVVAREYGIPAVVGVHQATSRLKDGQRIRIDGTTGKIMILEEGGSSNHS
jgi:phosphohistidine swiveling domain-containing protein